MADTSSPNSRGGEPAHVEQTWDGKTGEKCPEPNCDGAEGHDGPHFCWVAE